MYFYLMVLTICSASGLQVWQVLFDNFSVHIIGLDGYHIGIIQSIREIPGFLCLLVVYVLLLVREHRLAAFSVLTLGAGVALAGFFPSFTGIICTTLLLSFGFHYFETANQSLTLQYFDKQQAPLVFGKMHSMAALSCIVVGIIVFVLSPVLSYKQVFLLFGATIIVTAIWMLSKKPVTQGVVPQHKHMVLRKKYWLYYSLTFMAGARRQIFIAFAVFLLVKKFDYTVQEVAALFLLNNAVNFFLAPFIGKCINTFGERKVLSLEYGALIFIFIAYAMVDSKVIAALLYIADHIFFNFAIAIRTFFQKIAEPADIAPSMAVGFTINHIAAVVLPVLGGILWLIDYRIPFLAGAVLCCISLLLVQNISSQLAEHSTVPTV